MARRKRLGKTVSTKEVQGLLEDSHWVVVEDLTNRSLTMYHHPDGRVLVSMVDHGILVEAPNSQAYLDLLRQAKTEFVGYPHGKHILVGHLPQGRDFMALVPQLLAELPALLNLPPEDLDFTQSSLAKIDPKLKRKGRVKSTEPPLFPALVAYMGEIMRRPYQGAWRMRLAEDGRTWVPWIVIPSEHVCDIASQVLTTLTERSLALSNVPPMWIGFRHPPHPDFWNETEKEE